MIAAASVHRIAVPMIRTVVHAAASRSIAENVVLSLEGGGLEGAGECVPRQYVTGETPASAFEALSSVDLGAVATALDWSDFGRFAAGLEALALDRHLSVSDRPALAAACALEIALLDLAGKSLGVPLSRLADALDLPPGLRQSPGQAHPFGVTLDMRSDLGTVQRMSSRTIHHLKIKLGQSREQDLERVRWAREFLGSAASIAVDVNMAWSLEEAIEMVGLLAPFGIRWYEEPLERGAIERYRELRRRTGVQVMLDESLCSRADGERAVEAQACDLFNIRLSKCGGLIASLRLAELAHVSGLGFQLGVQVGESAVLEAAERHFVSAVRGWCSFEGVGASRRLEHSLSEDPLEFDEKRRLAYDLPSPGLGIRLSHEAVARYSQEQASWRDGRWERR